MGLRDFFRRTPPARQEPRIEFVGEQDGENERRLKSQLAPVLQQHADVERAYLARVGFQPTDRPSVVLCLATSAGENLKVLRQIEEVFRTIAPANVFLDVAFLTAAQEEDVSRVCPPFYRR